MHSSWPRKDQVSQIVADQRRPHLVASHELLTRLSSAIGNRKISLGTRLTRRIYRKRPEFDWPAVCFLFLPTIDYRIRIASSSSNTPQAMLSFLKAFFKVITISSWSCGGRKTLVNTGPSATVRRCQVDIYLEAETRDHGSDSDPGTLIRYRCGGSVYPQTDRPGCCSAW